MLLDMVFKRIFKSNAFVIRTNGADEQALGGPPADGDSVRLCEIELKGMEPMRHFFVVRFRVVGILAARIGTTVRPRMVINTATN